MTKAKLVEQLREYFAAKGKILTAEEYKAAEDAPYRYQIVKRTAGSWARMKSLVNQEGTSFSAAELVEPVVAEPEVVVVEVELEEPAVKKVTGKNG